MPKYIIIFTTASSQKEAEIISKILLKKKLCACVNIIGSMGSAFWWNNKIDKAKEKLLIIKTKSSYFKKIEKEILKNHSYDVPEIIAVPIVLGSKKYLEWIGSNTKSEIQ